LLEKDDFTSLWTSVWLFRGAHKPKVGSPNLPPTTIIVGLRVFSVCTLSHGITEFQYSTYDCLK